MPVNIFEVDTVQTKLDIECASVGLTNAQLICRYYSLIVRFERNTRKYHEFIAGIVYECVARVTMPQAMNE